MFVARVKCEENINFASHAKDFFFSDFIKFFTFFVLFSTLILIISQHNT